MVGNLLNPDKEDEHKAYDDLVSLPASFMVWLASPEAAFLKSKFLWTNWDVDELMERAAEIEASTELNIQVVGWPFGKIWKPEWKSQSNGSA